MNLKRLLLTSSFYLASFSPVIAQLNGNYTINSALPTGSGNFQTFIDLAAVLNTDGVSGNAVITVTPGSGPYNEQVVFTTVPGAGPSATVIIEGSGETITALTTTTDRHVVRLTDVQYFTIDNLKVAWNPASTGGFYGIHIYNSGHFITISNCAVDISGTNSTLYGAYVASGSETSILDSGLFSDISIINDTATGGGYGVSVFGTATSLATNIEITGNTFYDFHSNGVYLRETDGAIIVGNTFNKRTQNVTSVNAIQIAQAANINANIYNNIISVSQLANGSMTFRGIYLFNGTGHKVYNNVIHDIRLTSGNFTGIEVRTGGTAPEIYYNTISIDNSTATTGDLYGIKEELSNTNSILVNNLISISQSTTGNKAGLVIGATAVVTTAFSSDYNLIWTPNGNTAMKNGTNPTFYPTLADWRTASTQDMNSVDGDPVFISSTLSIPTNVAFDNLAFPISWITTDILGIARDVTPDIGAYEFPSTNSIASLHSGLPSAYPNPFTSYLSLTNFSEGDELRIYNSLGGLILRTTLEGAEVIATQNWAPGIYLYSVRGAGNTVTNGRLVKP